MELESIVPKINIKKPNEILGCIIEHNIKSLNNSAQDLVNVTVHISHNSVVTGKPIKINEDKICVFLTDSESIIYYQLPEISNIQISKPELIWELITDGAYFKIPLSNLPTSFQLKKNWAELQEMCKISYGFSLHQNLLSAKELSDTIKYQIQQLITILKQTFSSIARDAIGLETLQSLDSITIKSGEKDMSVSLENEKDLDIKFNFDKKLNTHMAEELQKQIESKF